MRGGEGGDRLVRLVSALINVDGGLLLRCAELGGGLLDLVYLPLNLRQLGEQVLRIDRACLFGRND